ncbi:MAG: PKD domain-containing protein [Bacteroidia bacterium]|jgi:PKD repeat protein|nr:PKD domain-containing protein [Bacteroidia bacterium]
MKKLLLAAFAALSSMVVFAQTQIPVVMPAQSSTFSSNVRGYYFTAPSCITLTGVEVPTTASTGAQSIAIVRFAAIPPIFSATTNNFSVLYLTQNNPASGIIPVNIQIEQGDIIGVLGQRATVNSYATGPATVTIDGFPVTLNRLGMQFQLTTTAPQQLWTESSGSISRVNLYYDTLITNTVSATQQAFDTYSFASTADTSFQISWNFGDNSPVVIADTPTHQYSSTGTYNVCCYITNNCGTDTICTTVSVCVNSVSNFSSSVNNATVSFTDQTTSSPVSWIWDFGDGSPLSPLQNPSHTYSQSGTYTVCLVSGNSCSSDTFCSQVTVCLPTIAGFTSLASGGTIQFTDTSQSEVTSWIWDFGDGSPIDLTASPSHTYNANGTYTVCLIASSLCSADTVCSTVTICLPVSASFTSLVNGGTVSFTGTSSNATTWIYDYGDGSPLDSVQNGQHTYTANGDYVVCFTATSGCSTVVVCDTITICMPVVANFSWVEGSASLLFSDSSLNATSWSWDFGDASPTDTTQNTAHFYQQNGIYTVCLIASNACSSDTFCTTITNCIFPLSAGFTPVGTGLNYTFTNNSQGAASYFWDFDDNGATSVNASPSHTFSFSGQHIVCLTAYNVCGDSITTCDTVLVIVAGFGELQQGATLSLFPNPMSENAMLLVSMEGHHGMYSLELVDVSGKVVRTETGMVNEVHPIGRGNLATGIYAYRVMQNGVTLGSGKLIVE